ncbi:MAG: ATP-binding cassette domain-containing protein [Gammaproteobacteria bacterium]|nr:ATP-binding cassette domain-containing protein [Gammaproteobacteria bacterium]
MLNKYRSSEVKKPGPITLENVTFSRSGRKILDNISISIPSGKIIAIMGPSGTGKSTLMKLMTGELKPDVGSVMFNGKNIPDLSSRSLYEYRKEIGVMLQSNALFNELSVFENVAFPLREHFELKEDFLQSLVKLKLEKVGLRNACDLIPSELSGGMARRVSLARAIVRDPSIMFYDEPFTGQDPITRWVLLELIRRLHTTLNMTSVLVSHQVEMMTQLADVVYILSEGKIISSGTPKAVFKDKNPLVRKFVDGYSDGSKDMIHHPGQSLVEDLFK